MDGVRAALLQRSISACAEAPPTRCSCACTPEVYLRVCGGTEFLRQKLGLFQGLSPRVRRHPPQLIDAPGSRGSISACAEAP